MKPKRFKSVEEESEHLDQISAADLDEGPADIHVTLSPRLLVSFRVDHELVQEIRKIAKKKGISPQTLMRQWLWERVELEKGKLITAAPLPPAH